MNITTVQWNIGGGKILKPGADPMLMASYSVDGLADIIEFLKFANPDLITLQEVHRKDDFNQAERIAQQLGLGYVVSDFLVESHVEAGYELGQAIISRFPITDHSFEPFYNPKLEIVWEDGTTAISHDKGVTKAMIDADGTIFTTVTTHLMPFRKFEVDIMSGEGARILADVQAKLATDGSLLLQGDFNLNYETLAPVLPNLFADGLQEALQIESTTPKGSHYDHVVYRALRLIESTTNLDVLTDHYPIVTKFEL